MPDTSELPSGMLIVGKPSVAARFVPSWTIPEYRSMAVKLYPLREPFSRETEPPRRPPPLTLRRQPRRNFPLQFFFCARPLKKIQKRKGKFLLGFALQVFGRCGGASTLRAARCSSPPPPPPRRPRPPPRGRLAFPPPTPLLPSRPRFGAGKFFRRAYFPLIGFTPL